MYSTETLGWKAVRQCQGLYTRSCDGVQRGRLSRGLLLLTVIPDSWRCFIESNQWDPRPKAWNRRSKSPARFQLNQVSPRGQIDQLTAPHVWFLTIQPSVMTERFQLKWKHDASVLASVQWLRDHLTSAVRKPALVMQNSSFASATD